MSTASVLKKGNHNIQGKKMSNRKCLTNVASQDIKGILLWLIHCIKSGFLIFTVTELLQNELRKKKLVISKCC